jgi:ATP-binding protein involved in chromosome partitioning
LITTEQVLHALSNVMDPDLHKDLVSLKMIEDIHIEGEKVSFTLVLTTPACPLRAQLERDARESVKTQTGATEVNIKVISRSPGEKPLNLGENQFGHVIAVGSGKGGVGKSTIAANLAISLAQQGASVGLMDADIYGPNTPRMLGIEEFHPTSQDEQKIQPAIAHGIKVVSIGFFVQEGQPLIWRGPMLHSAIQQFLSDFDWGCLDYLVVDLPPGTGDVQLSLAQSLPISGAVLVTTPQAVAVDDAYRAASMFEKLGVPVLGIVENMAFLELPDGSHMTLFGEGGGRMLAERSGVPFLGSIPFDQRIVQNGDSGLLIVENHVESPSAQGIRTISSKLAAELSKQAYARTQGE